MCATVTVGKTECLMTVKCDLLLYLKLNLYKIDDAFYARIIM